jgi:hypothetical protein
LPHWLPMPPPWLRLTLLALRTGALSLVALLVLSSTTSGGTGRGSAPAPPHEHRSVAERQLIERHNCSTTGFVDDEPESAIVRSVDGRLRLISFERAWRLFTHHDTALVATCLDAPPS